jgi:hypothetical protein
MRTFTVLICLQINVGTVKNIATNVGTRWLTITKDRKYSSE